MEQFDQNIHHHHESSLEYTFNRSIYKKENDRNIFNNHGFN